MGVGRGRGFRARMANSVAAPVTAGSRGTPAGLLIGDTGASVRSLEPANRQVHAASPKAEGLRGTSRVQSGRQVFGDGRSGQSLAGLAPGVRERNRGVALPRPGHRSCLPPRWPVACGGMSERVGANRSNAGGEVTGERQTERSISLKLNTV